MSKFVPSTCPTYDMEESECASNVNVIFKVL